MPRHDAKRSPAEHLSRRSVLAGAATAGAASLAVTAIGASAIGATASPALAATNAHSDPNVPSGPIVVHVRDAKSGDIEVFSGTSQTQLRDKDLAARIARAIG
ncbi:MAG: hypothetical protein ACRDOB_16970 [Streptosporangiaceae bacterium]